MKWLLLLALLPCAVLGQPDRLVINVGNEPNDNTGDSVRTGFQKCNINFFNLWGMYGVLNSNIFNLWNWPTNITAQGMTLSGQEHLVTNPGDTGGAWLFSDQPDKFNLSAGVQFTNGTWLARTVDGSILQLTGDALDLWQTNGLTAGNAFPTATTRTFQNHSGVVSMRDLASIEVADFYGFGDSFTAGNGATTQANQYFSLITANRSSVPHNMGVGGSHLQDEFAQIYPTVIQFGTLSTLLTGINDMRAIGQSQPDQQNYEEALSAAIVWLGLTDNRKLRAANMAKTGTWAPNSFYGITSGVTASATNASLSCTVPGATVWIAATRINSGGGTFNVNVDGINFGNFSCNGATVSATTGQSYQPFVVRIANLTLGSHAIIVTALGGAPVNIDWVGSNYDVDARSGPSCYVGNCCRLPTASYTDPGQAPHNHGSDAAVFQFNARIARAVKTASMDGLNVRLVKVSEHYDPLPPNISPDNIHPSDAGHALIAAKFLSELNQLATAKTKMQGSVLDAGGSAPLSLGTYPSVFTIDPSTMVFSSIQNGRYQAAGARNDAKTGQWIATDTYATIVTQTGASVIIYADSALTVGTNYTPTAIANISPAGLGLPSGEALTVGSAGVFDTDSTPGNTRLLLWDVNAATLKRVSVGAPDSGGAGYRVLRVAN